MMEIKEETEVTIIGGGALGCLTAYHLAKKGTDVILVERGDLASGAIGASNGWVVPAGSGSLFSLLQAGVKMYQELDEETKKRIEYRVANVLECFTDEDVRRMKKLWPGTDQNLKKRDELEEPEPNLADDITWVRESTLTYVNPLKLCYVFANYARKFGAKIFTRTKVTDIIVKDGKVRGVKTDRGEIITKFVVNAAGAWAPIIGRMVGLDIPIVPVLGQILVTEPTPPLLRNYHTILGVGWSTTLYPEKEEEWSQHVKFGIFEGTLTEYWPGEGSYLLGGCRFQIRDPEHAPQPIPEITKLIAEHAIRYIPKLGRLHIIRSYVGLRPMCAVDGLPIIGNVEEVEGFILATGTDWYGISAAMIFGKLLSELIRKNATSEPIDEFSYSRFKQA